MGRKPYTGRLIAAIAVALISLSGCDTRIYVRDGVTDGNRFSLPLMVYADSDPVVQSWIAYSLDRSFCQLEHGGENPARHSSFACELSARESLVERWREIGGRAISGIDDQQAAYLDIMAQAQTDGMLDDYVWHFLQRKQWIEPASLDAAQFARWRREHLPRRHKPVTRIIGSWGYVDAKSDAGDEAT
ncbi:MAG: hypothetical protein AAFO81_07510 [Pseudomonadota bacterium]